MVLFVLSGVSSATKERDIHICLPCNWVVGSIKLLKKLVGNPWLRHSNHPERYVKLYFLHDHVTTPLCKQHCECTHWQVHHEHPPIHL